MMFGAHDDACLGLTFKAENEKSADYRRSERKLSYLEHITDQEKVKGDLRPGPPECGTAPLLGWDRAGWKTA
jgi:hypothetical protein